VALRRLPLLLLLALLGSLMLLPSIGRPIQSALPPYLEGPELADPKPGVSDRSGRKLTLRKAVWHSLERAPGRQQTRLV
jgi:hypothetical protein